MSDHQPGALEFELDKWVFVFGPLALIAFAYRAWRRRYGGS